VSGTDWGRVDASEALLKGVRGLLSVKGYDVAGSDTGKGVPPPLDMDAFSFELYMQRRSLPSLQVCGDLACVARVTHLSPAHTMRRTSRTSAQKLPLTHPPPLPLHPLRTPFPTPVSSKCVCVYVCVCVGVCVHECIDVCVCMVVCARACVHIIAPTPPQHQIMNVTHFSQERARVTAAAPPGHGKVEKTSYSQALLDER